MQKTAVSVTVTTLVLGVFGAFLRWLQNNGAYDAKTGCITPWHALSIVLVIYCILAVAMLLAIDLLWLRQYGHHDDAAALRCTSGLPIALSWVFGVVFALSACLVMFSAANTRFPMTQRLLGAFGILAGLSFPFLPVKQEGGHALSRVAVTALTIFCCFWLVCAWRSHSENPVTWRFVMEILAIAASAAAFYYIAAYHFDLGRGSRAIFSVQLAVFFNLVTLFDARSTAQRLMFLLVAAMLLLLEMLLVENRWEIWD